MENHKPPFVHDLLTKTRELRVPDMPWTYTCTLGNRQMHMSGRFQEQQNEPFTP